MKIVSESHLDHGLSDEAIAHIKEKFADRDGFFIETFDLPDSLASGLTSGLFGPLVGDEPVNRKDVWLAKRPGRDGLSPLVKSKPRLTNTVTVIAGPHGDDSCVLYTAHGGPAAPREPWDPGLKDDDEALTQSFQFWAEHALAKPEGLALVRIKRTNYDEVIKRLGACDISCEDVDRPGGTHPKTGDEMVCLAVQCSGSRFHSIIEDLADVVYPE